MSFIPDSPESADKHIQIVGILHITLASVGVVCTIFMAFVFLCMAGGVSIGMLHTSSRMPGMDLHAGYRFFAGWLALGAFIVGLFGLCSVPGLVGGVFILKARAWARWVVIVVSGFYCLAFPIGTLVGAYSIWVMLNSQVEARFTSVRSSP